MKWLWIKLVAQHVESTVAAEMDSLIELVRKLQVN